MALLIVVAIGAVLLGLLAAGIAWLRANPSPLPYSQRAFVQGPHPGLGHERLREALRPEPDEHVLEIGPGTGYHSLAVAEWISPGTEWISPGGVLHIVDVIPEWLEHTRVAAAKRGIENIAPTQADATSLPFESETFDAAYLVQVLGEVGDQEATLRELRRVLKPRGRLVVGESVLDPHVVTFRSLRERAGAAGLRVEAKIGGPLAYFARLRAEEPVA